MPTPAFLRILDEAIRLPHHPGSPSAEIDFTVPAHVTTANGVLYYTLVPKVVYQYELLVNEQVVVANADVGPDGEHKVRLTIPAGLLREGDNDLQIAVHSGGRVYVSDISAWLQGSPTATPDEVMISRETVELQLTPSTSTYAGTFRLPAGMDDHAAGAIEFTIRQGQPRLTYSMWLNGDPAPIEKGALPAPAGSYDLLEYVDARVFRGGDNRLTIELGYGGDHIYFAEIIVWWDRA